MSREYEFFVSTDQHHLVDGDERVLVRQLVMRNFFNAKSNVNDKTESEHSSYATENAKERLNGKFRVPQFGRQRAPRGKAKRKESTTDDDVDMGRQERKAKMAKMATDQSGMADWMSCMIDWSSTKILFADGGGGVKQENPMQFPPIHPDIHGLEPFDVLPVPGSHQLDILLKLHASGSRLNSMSFNACNTWWHFICNDAGLLHAALATWALYGVLVKGIHGLWVEKLWHKDEAMKEANVKLASREGGYSDELVGIVVTLASLENLSGAYDTAKIHIDALRRIINERGDIFSFIHNDGLIRGITWVDFHSAVVSHTLPSYPRINLSPNAPPLPEALLASAADSSPTSLLHLSICAIDCFDIFHSLNRLALCISAGWIHRIDRLTLSNLMYDIEYNILSKAALTHAFLNSDSRSGKAAADWASVIEAIYAAVHVFIYAELREMPPTANLFSVLLSRLRDALDRPNARIVDVWNDQKNLNILLWVLVVASAIAPKALNSPFVNCGTSSRSWWITQLASVATTLGVETELQLEQHMRKVAWTTDIFLGPLLAGIWRDVEENKTMRMRMEGAAGLQTILQADDALDTKDSESTLDSIGSDKWRGDFESWTGNYDEVWANTHEQETLSETNWYVEETVHPNLLWQYNGGMTDDVKPIYSF